ncbi:MAG: hypothetical protein ACK5PQ_01515 [Alphaproteobacteria bacterium]
MKVILIPIFLFFLSVLYVGQGLADSSSRKAGFYMGPSLGVSQVFGEHEMVYFNQGGVGGAGIIAGCKSGGDNTSLYGGLIGGYHHPVMEKSFVDFEVYYNHQNNQADLILDNNGFVYVSVNLKKKYSYGAALSLGTVFYDGLGVMPLSGYIRLGIEKGAVQTKRRYDGNERLGDPQDSKTVTSFAPGLGLKLDVNDKSFVKLGYVYVFPHTYRIHLPYPNAMNGGGYYNHKFRHSEQRVELSVGWRF